MIEGHCVCIVGKVGGAIDGPQPEELAGLGHADWPRVSGSRHVLIWAGDVGGGLEDPTGPPLQGQRVAVACGLQYARRRVAEMKNQAVARKTSNHVRITSSQNVISHPLRN